MHRPTLSEQRGSAARHALLEMTAFDDDTCLFDKDALLKAAVK